MTEFATHDSRFQPLMTLKIGETLPVEDVDNTNRTVLILAALEPTANGGAFQRVGVHTFAKVQIDATGDEAVNMPPRMVWRRID
jgi:hypothetical protein